MIGQGSPLNCEALPGSLSERSGWRHSEGHPALLLVLSVLQEPSDWSEVRRCHTQDQEVPEGGRGQKRTFRKHFTVLKGGPEGHGVA